MKEIWKDIYFYNHPTNEWIDYRGTYQVSNLGRVRSLDRDVVCGDGKYTAFYKGRLLSPATNNKGYLYVSFQIAGKKKKGFKIHRLVASMFVENPNNYPEVNHKDEDKTNNNAENLEWCSSSYNHNFGTRTIRAVAKTKKKVVQKDLDGNIINIYDSTVQAAKAVNGYSPLISLACRKIKQRTHKGYIWEYL